MAVTADAALSVDTASDLLNGNPEGVNVEQQKQARQKLVTSVQTIYTQSGVTVDSAARAANQLKKIAQPTSSGGTSTSRLNSETAAEIVNFAKSLSDTLKNLRTQVDQDVVTEAIDATLSALEQLLQDVNSLSRRRLQGSSDVVTASENAVDAIVSAMYALMNDNGVNRVPRTINSEYFSGVGTVALPSYAKDVLTNLTTTNPDAMLRFNTGFSMPSGLSCSYFTTVLAVPEANPFSWYSDRELTGIAVIPAMEDCEGNSMNLTAGIDVTVTVPVESSINEDEVECVVWDRSSKTFVTNGVSLASVASDGMSAQCDMTRLGVVTLAARANPSPTPPVPPDDDGLSALAIVMIVLGSVLVVAIIFVLIVLARRRNRQGVSGKCDCACGVASHGLVMHFLVAGLLACSVCLCYVWGWQRAPWRLRTALSSPFNTETVCCCIFLALFDLCCLRHLFGVISAYSYIKRTAQNHFRPVLHHVPFAIFHLSGTGHFRFPIHGCHVSVRQ